MKSGNEFRRDTNTSAVPGVGPGTDVHVAYFDEPTKKWMTATYPPLVAEARARALETSDISLASLGETRFPTLGETRFPTFGELLFVGHIQNVTVRVVAL